MRRAALLDCFDSMQAACSKAWAQLSTEIAIEVCYTAIKALSTAISLAPGSLHCLIAL